MTKSGPLYDAARMPRCEPGLSPAEIARLRAAYALLASARKGAQS